MEKHPNTNFNHLYSIISKTRAHKTNEPDALYNLLFTTAPLTVLGCYGLWPQQSVMRTNLTFAVLIAAK